jgi:anti-sigma factor RsiW
MNMTFWNPCGRVERRLSLSAAGVLPEADRRPVELHLARCPRCQARFRTLQAVAARLQTMGQALPPVDAPASLRRRWEQEVLGATHRQPGSGSVLVNPATGWLSGWLSQAGVAWGAVAVCWALAALFRWSAPEAPRPAVDGTPLSLNEILLVLERERPRPYPPAFPANRGGGEPTPSRPSARSESPMALEAA